MSVTASEQTAGFNSSIYLKQYHKIVLNSYKKKKNCKKTIFYLAYSPPEQCAHNELEFELESKLNVSGFDPTACNEWV